VWLGTWSLGLREKAGLSKCVLRKKSEYPPHPPPPKKKVVKGFQEILYNEDHEEER